MRNLLLIVCLFTVIAACAAGGRYAYMGKVGIVPIQLNLAIDGQELSGWYYYESLGTTIQLEGTLAKDGTATLYEYMQDPLHTNHSSEKRTKNRLVGTFAPSMLEMTGNWISADDQDTYPFTMKAVASYTEIKQDGKGASFTGSYPTFLTATAALKTIESQLRKKIMDSQKGLQGLAKDYPPEDDADPWEERDDDQLAYFSSDLIAIQVVSWLRASGAATAGSGTVTVNYRLSNGKVTKLNLKDLFAPKADYLAALRKYISTDLKRQEAEIPETLTEDGGLDAFLIGPVGLTFIFDDMLGADNVLVPYDAIHNLVNPDGPLGRFVQTK